MNDIVINCSNIRDLPEPAFISQLVKEEDVLIEGAEVRCFRIEQNVDDDTINEWARHIRRHYLRDDEVKSIITTYKADKARRLLVSRIPDRPEIRGGDFAEITISDLVQYIEGYEVPRYKQHGRKDKNSSEHGTDVLAYKIIDPTKPSEDDELLGVEVKSQSASTRLRKAITEAAKDSLKDRSRIAMTIDYYVLMSTAAKDTRTSSELERFLNASEHPYKETFAIGALAGIVDAKQNLEGKSASDLMTNGERRVFIIHRADLMNLIRSVYNRCLP